MTTIVQDTYLDPILFEQFASSQAGSENLRWDIFEIGVWDMSAGAGLTVPFPSTRYVLNDQTIRAISIGTIIDDAGNFCSVTGIKAKLDILLREVVLTQTGTAFQSPEFSGTTSNRGVIFLSKSV